MTPAITFVIPAFNARATLGDALRSLLGQSRPDWHAVVVDDGSADDTAAVARRHADRRIRVVRQGNRGLAGARNRGLRETDADAVCFLDADDRVHPDFARCMLEALPGTDLAACAYRMVGPGLEDLGWTVPVAPYDASPDRLIEFNPFAVGGVVVRRSTATRLIGEALFDERLRVHEDWDCWLRLSAAGARWSMVDRPLFDYRISPGSMSADLGRMWAVGLDVIARASAPAELRARAARNWTIRHIARAVARGDADLCTRLRAELRAGGRDLHAADAGLLAGSLRWALAREAGAAPDAPGPWLAEGRARAARMLARLRAVKSILRRLDTAPGSGRDWDRVAACLAEKAHARRVTVLYGMGRNGRDLLGAFERRAYDGPLAWIDDDPAAVAPKLRGRALPRLRPDHLTPRHLVFVTPDSGDAIAARLRAAGLTDIETRDSLIIPSPPALAATD